MVLACLGSGGIASGAGNARLDYDRDVRPILSEKCFLCHGQDPKKRMAGLRLDSFEGATADRGGHAALVPGKLDASAMYQRITAEQPARRMPPVFANRTLTPDQIAISTVDADGESIFELARSIDTLRANGRRTSELDGKWWHKLSGPLSAVLMPLLGAVAAFGLARSGALLIRAVIGMALGFAYFVFDNAALALGNFGGYPPLIAAWGPFLLFLLVGETVLIRTEE